MVRRLVCQLASAVFWLVAAIAALPSARSAATEQSFDWNAVSHFLAFGNSYTFVQGTHGYPNRTFIGSLLPDEFAFTPGELVSNEIIQNYTGQSAGGPNWSQYLTGCAAESGHHLPADCDMQLWNFAFAGAIITTDLLPPPRDFTTNLVNQTRQFLDHADRVLRDLASLEPSKALVAIWIGINDVNLAMRDNVASRDFFGELIGAVLDESVDPLYDAGFRNFLLLNQPPMDRRVAAEDRPASSNPDGEMLGWWNDELEDRAGAWQEERSGAKAMVFDANSLLNTVLDDPGSYDISNTTGTCEAREQYPEVADDPESLGCPVPVEEYFWFDNGHMYVLNSTPSTCCTCYTIP